MKRPKKPPDVGAYGGLGKEMLGNEILSELAAKSTSSTERGTSSDFRQRGGWSRSLQCGWSLNGRFMDTLLTSAVADASPLTFGARGARFGRGFRMLTSDEV